MTYGTTTLGGAPLGSTDRLNRWTVDATGIKDITVDGKLVDEITVDGTVYWTRT